MPACVWKKVVSLQRKFLWGGVKGGKKTCWVKWSNVCKEKSQGGLGVRDVRLVNQSLLAKWRWRLLQPGLPLWKQVLVAKYGNHILHHVEWGNFRNPASSSNWWKDIRALDNVVDGKNWLLESIVRKIGNGNSTLFWSSNWLGGSPLSLTFPRLFSLSNHKESVVADFFVRSGDGGRWSFSWRRSLFQWELDLVNHLEEILTPIVLKPEEDSWRWIPDSDGAFSVNSAYNFLVGELHSLEASEGEVPVVFEQIWESPAPSKVIAFSWQLLYDRIPTSANLVARHIVAPDASRDCVGCDGCAETSLHLFLHCPSAITIWYDICSWLGLVVIIPPSLPVLFEVFRASAKNKKIRKGYLLIWHVTLWSIWKARNGTLFANGSFNAKAVVDDIKVLSWKWSLARLNLAPSLFYEWTWDPGDCFLR
ncbi:hypothetical protein QL285_016880 [Trifolium repens]|nr:hypothetical protein QL285_016880 [Trifolium repens]